MTRTDNDTWDLASSVGATATLVAAARAVATNADQPLIDDPYAEPLVRAVGVDFLTRWATGEIDVSQVEDDAVGWGMKHMPYVMAARTQFFDEFFAAAAEAGIRQAVILASGLDSRAYRLSWPADTKVYEIDQPQVIAFKRATLSQVGAKPAAQLKSLAIDLRADWVAALEDSGFDPAQPSAWIAEGLLAYLPPAAQDSLLEAVTALSAPGSMLGVEAVPGSPTNDDARAALQTVAKTWREYGLDVDFASLIYDGERREVAEFLDERGWDTDAVPMGTLLADKGYPPIPTTSGDPSFADVLYTTSRKRR